MKKLLAVTLIVLLTIAAFNAWDNSWHGAWNQGFYIDGDEVDGPLGWLLGVLFAGGGLLIGAVAIVCVALLVGLLFAGLGTLLVVGMGALAIALVAALSPLLLPLLLVVGIVWFCGRRNRERRAAMKEAAV